jgi:cytoskeletal protein RodZ
MESGKESLSFGRYLQAIRLEKKISLEQVSQQTRIGLGNLLLLEQEDHDQLPAEVYVKGFLRSYAKAIGADGDEVIRRYGSRLDVVQKISKSEFSGKKKDRLTWWKLLLSLVLFICIITVSLIVVVFFQQAPDVNKSNTALEQKSAVAKEQAAEPKTEHQVEPKTEQQVESQAEQQVEPQAEKPSPETDFKSAKEVPEKWLLNVTTVEETWLKVIMDEKAPAVYNLKPGDQLELEATTMFNLLIGNAGGLILRLNDKPVSIPGKSGEVVTLELP